MPQRPNNFTINRNHPLAKVLVFAGLGAHAGATRYHDSSAYGNTGTLTNMEMTDWVPDGTLGRGCINLGGTNEWVTVPSLKESTTSLSVAAWVKTSATNALTVFGRYYSATNSRVWSMQLANTAWGATGDEFSVIISNNGTLTDPNYKLYYIDVNVSDGTWHHWAWTFSADTLVLYLDGNAVTPVTYKNGGVSALYAGTATPTIGAINVDGTAAQVFTGSVADPVVFNRVLVKTEIQQLADPSNVMLSGLINYPRRKWWPVVSGAATTPIPVFMNQYRQRVA